jgi:hypothetical protein
MSTLTDYHQGFSAGVKDSGVFDDSYDAWDGNHRSQDWHRGYNQGIVAYCMVQLSYWDKGVTIITKMNFPS